MVSVWYYQQNCVNNCFVKKQKPVNASRYKTGYFWCKDGHKNPTLILKKYILMRWFLTVGTWILRKKLKKKYRNFVVVGITIVKKKKKTWSKFRLNSLFVLPVSLLNFTACDFDVISNRLIKYSCAAYYVRLLFHGVLWCFSIRFFEKP